MPKQSGLGDQLFISGVDIGADISAIGGLSTPRETLPATNITQFAQARMYGKRDGSAEFTCYFNPDAGSTHDTLNNLPLTDVHLMYLRGTTLGNEGIGLVGKQVNYDPNRGDDGSLMFGVSVQANAFGIDWGRQLTAGKVSHTTATNGASVDFGSTGTAGSTAFGWQAYLQVFSLTGTSCTVTIQTSSDDAVGDPFSALTGGGFTAATGATVQRLESSSATATVERYVRIVTSGTFTECSFAVLFTRNEALRSL